MPTITPIPCPIWGETDVVWDSTVLLWDSICDAVEIIKLSEGGGPGGYDNWDRKIKPAKKKKIVKLVMEYNNLSIEKRKEMADVKIHVRDVSITLEDLIRKVEKIIFIDN